MPRHPIYQKEVKKNPILREFLSLTASYGNDSKLCLLAGVNKNAIYCIKTGKVPTVLFFNTLLAPLGYELRIVKKDGDFS